jgi:steroid delta-isomerase-like uncharacterized protein
MADAWNKRDFAKIRNMVHPEYTYTGGDGKEIAGGPDVALSIGQMYASAFPDGVLEVRRVYTHGDTAIAEMTARGTHTGDLNGIAPTGKRVEIVICNIAEMRDGKIYREREYIDMLAMMTQLGVLSMPGKASGAKG